MSFEGNIYLNQLVFKDIYQLQGISKIFEYKLSMLTILFIITNLCMFGEGIVYKLFIFKPFPARLNSVRKMRNYWLTQEFRNNSFRNW